MIVGTIRAGRTSRATIEQSRVPMLAGRRRWLLVSTQALRFMGDLDDIVGSAVVMGVYPLCGCNGHQLTEPPNIETVLRNMQTLPTFGLATDKSQMQALKVFQPPKIKMP